MTTRVQPARRTQEERTTATRTAVLDAAVDSLLEMGYAATTAALVAERAGVSRGAMQYHFRTKSELMAAAVEHLSFKIGQDLVRQVSRLPAESDGDRLAAAVDMLWSHFSGPLFPAWLELTVAGRTDPELQEMLDPVRDRLSRAIEHHTREAFGDTKEAATLATFIDMTLAVLAGLALARLTRVPLDRSQGAREERLLVGWKAAAPAVLGGL
ncbi:MAG: TetR/AcrR family transcriptional regulator [Acidimicrobiales bacterium]